MTVLCKLISAIYVWGGLLYLNVISTLECMAKPYLCGNAVCLFVGVKLLETECAELEHKAHPALAKLTVRVGISPFFPTTS